MKDQVIGLLNTTLKGIRITTGESVEPQSAKLIMMGILYSIPSKRVGEEFIDYCLTNYEIQLDVI